MIGIDPSAEALARFIIAIAVLLTRMGGRFRSDLAPLVVATPTPDRGRPTKDVV